MIRSKLAKRIVSGVSAVTIFASNILSFMPLKALADNAPATGYAHSINAFDIDIKSGADYYSSYIPDNPNPENASAHSSTSPLTDAYVWKATNSNEGHEFVYNIKLSISGEGTTDTHTGSLETEEAVGAGFIQIAVPAHILKDSSGSYADELELPVAHEDQVYYEVETDGSRIFYKTNPDGSITYDPHTFVYKYDSTTDQYIIYNTQPISAGVVYEFPISYHTTKNTWDYTDLAESDKAYAELTIRSWEKDKPLGDKYDLTSKTREIPVHIDTEAEILSTTKKAVMYDGEALISALAAKSATKLTELSDDYEYTVWSVNSVIDDVTQKYSLTLSDTAKPLEGNGLSAVGEIVAINMGSGYDLLDSPSVSHEKTISGLTSSGRRTDYVLVRYPKSIIEQMEAAPRPSIYEADNDVTVTLTPADNQDKKTEAIDDGLFIYELQDLTFHPIEEKYTAKKYGLYSKGTKRVGNKSNVSSYEMGKLDNTEGEGQNVSGIQYETFTSAYGYGRTVNNLNDVITEMSYMTSGDETSIHLGDRIYYFSSTNTDDYRIEYLDENGDVIQEKTETKPIGTYTDIDGNEISFTTSLEVDDMKMIAGQDIADTYYGQTELTYTLTDNKLEMSDITLPSLLSSLGTDDYRINEVAYAFNFKNSVYDFKKMEFSEGEENTDPSNEDIEFYVFVNGSDTAMAEPVGKYNISSKSSTYINSNYVKSLDGTKIVFADDAEITGYQIKTHNKYYYVELDTKPSLTLKPGDTLSQKAHELLNNDDTENKFGLKNTAEWEISNETTQFDRKYTISGTDYIADIVRKSDISKTALGLKVSYRGQDGKIYQRENDPLLGQYRLSWQVKVKELADGVEQNGTISDNVPVVQQSGVFYDLLPAHCDIIEGSVNVYKDVSGNISASTQALSPSSFEVLDRIDDYNGSGKKLLIIKINEPCNESYTVNYVTVHSHEDIQDYGDTALNTVAYQTGNSDIGGGYPDNGGNYAVTMSDYIKNLDPDNDNAKRFIYAESTEIITALYPTSSGIYKKVSTASDPTFGKSGTVRNGESYTYSIRMQNDSETNARDIAILDSIENYRKVNNHNYNAGFDKNRNWYGKITGVNLSGVKEKMAEYFTANPLTVGGSTLQGVDAAENQLKLMLYIGDITSTDEDYNADDTINIVDLDNYNYSDSEKRKELLDHVLANDLTHEDSETVEKWIVIDKQYWNDLTKWETSYKNAHPELGGVDLLKRVSGIIVYTGEDFVLPKGESISFNVNMTAPETVDDTREHYSQTGTFLPHPATYNNVYRSFTNQKHNTGTETYFYTHYDYTLLNFTTVGELKFAKTDTKTGKSIPDIEFSLTGVSDYGTSYNETLVSDVSGYVTFRNLERGEYTLIESDAGEDHIVDSTPRKVTVDFEGDVTIVTVDGTRKYLSNNTIESAAEGDEVEYSEGNLIVKGTKATVNGSPVLIETSYKINNDPRYHGDVEFRKLDSISGDGAKDAVFRLKGTSKYNTKYDLEVTSDALGNVVFEDIELGTYTLTEIKTGDGYMPPKNITFTVTGSGTDKVIYKITGDGADVDEDGYYINNTPFARLGLYKIDSITNGGLDDAEFTLTADSSLNTAFTDIIKGLKAQNKGWSEEEAKAYIQTTYGWTQSGGNWETVLTASNGTSGEYIFRYLPTVNDIGSFTLEETAAPDGHKALSESITVTVRKSGDKFIAESTGADYIIFDTASNSYVNSGVTSDNAEFIRLKNEPSYESDKSVYKVWVGGAPTNGKYPQFHLSSQELPKEPNIVTINSNFITLIQNNKANFTGFVKETSEPSESDLSTYTNYTLTGVEGEDGVFYAKWNSSDKKIHWWSDSKTIYFPIDCSSMFKDCNNSGFTSFTFGDDNTPFKTSKTTNMRSMFENCSNLTSINLQGMDTSNVINMAYMFNKCEKNQKFLLANFNTSNVTDMQYMFNRCLNVNEYDVSSFDTSKVTIMRNMFGNSDSGNNNSLTTLDISSFKTNSLTNIRDMFIRQKVLTTVYVNPAQWKKDKINYTDHNSNGGNTFKGCEKIVGEYGTAHGSGDGSNDINSSLYAIADEAENEDLNGNGIKGEKGYFTDINSLTAAQIATMRGITEEKAQEFLNSLKSDYVAPTPTTPSVTSDTSFPDLTSYGFVLNTKQPNDMEKSGIARDLDKEIGKFNYIYEYSTDETAVSSSPIKVKETIVLTVATTVKGDDGKYYTRSRKYTYTPDSTHEQIYATWVKDSSDQWTCQMEVIDAEKQMYAWEAPTPTGYTTKTDADHPVQTVGATDSAATIRNVKSNTPVGDLELSKSIKDYTGDAIDDEFKIKVTMKNADNTFYTVKPFDENGEAVYELKAGDEVIISGIPENCTYTVEELTNPENIYSYSEFTGTGGSSGKTGTIVKDTIKSALIVNEINTASVKLTKNAKLYKPNDSGIMTEVTDTTDKDRTAWTTRKFKFGVRFINLIEDENVKYHYQIGTGTLTEFTYKTELPKFKLADGEYINFTDLPVNVKYEFTEEESFIDDEYDSYTVVNSRSVGYTTNELVLNDSSNDIVFTNKKESTKPEIINIKISKVWKDSDGNTVKWLTNDDGDVVKMSWDDDEGKYIPNDSGEYIPYIDNGSGGKTYKTESSFPSFLKVYLGRGLEQSYLDSSGVSHTYLIDEEPGFMSASINAKGAWEYEFSDLLKYGEINTGTGKQTLPYVYYITEITPMGFENINTETKNIYHPDDDSFIPVETSVGSGEYNFSFVNKEIGTHELSVCKLVTGNMGNKAKEFNFEIVFKDSSGEPLVGTGLVMIVEDIQTGEQLRKRTLTLESSAKGKYAVSIADNTKVRFTNMPDGTLFTITEAQNGYIIKSKEYTIAETLSVDMSGLALSNEQQGILTADKHYIFVNELNVDVPTGIDLSTKAPVIVSISIFSCLLYLHIRRKKCTDNSTK